MKENLFTKEFFNDDTGRFFITSLKNWKEVCYRTY